MVIGKQSEKLTKVPTLLRQAGDNGQTFYIGSIPKLSSNQDIYI